MSAIVFLDTETTGLSLDDDIWEVAAVRREEDGSERELHLFVEHDGEKCQRLPESFREDHRARFPSECSQRAYTRKQAASEIWGFTRGAHIVGAVPNFDTERIALLIAKSGSLRAPNWHYHLIDVENLAVGYLAAKEPGLTHEGQRVVVPPFDSEALSFFVGVNADDFPRHTAMGDVRWAMAIYDAVIGSSSRVNGDTK